MTETTHPATTADIPTISTKIALLRLLRDSAVTEKYDHAPVDNGRGRCTDCGRPVQPYASHIPGRAKVLSHKRGWAGRAQRSKVDLSVRAIAQRLGVDEHTVAHLLWSLQKQGLVTFRESKGTTAGAKTVGLENIRLTPLGLTEKPPSPNMPTIEERIAKAESEVSTNGMYAGYDVTTSDTEIGNDVAADGVITKVADWVFDVTPDGETPPLPEPEPEPTPVPQPEPVRLPVRITALNGEKYPGLMDLLTREHKRRDALEATTLLERAGLIDLATQVVTAIPDNTELEQEVIDYLTEIGVRA